MEAKKIDLEELSQRGFGGAVGISYDERDALVAAVRALRACHEVLGHGRPNPDAEDAAFRLAGAALANVTDTAPGGAEEERRG